MMVICPNCGQETHGADCQWCRYPLVGSWPVNIKMKVFGWLVTVVLALIIGSFGFLYFSNDYNIYLVRSESMKPAINMGDMAIAGSSNGPLNGEIKPGMIVTYEHGKGLITHRVLSIDGDTLTTKGDALEETDPWSVTLSDVRGVYLFKVPYIGYIPSFIRTKLGWFVSIILPATLLVGLLVKDIVKEALSSS